MSRPLNRGIKQVINQMYHHSLAKYSDDLEYYVIRKTTGGIHELTRRRVFMQVSRNIINENLE